MSTSPNVTVTLSAEDKGVSAAITALVNQLKQLIAAQNATAASAHEAAAAEGEFTGSLHKAREAATLATEETGVKLSRGLRGLIAESKTLGPLMEAAFPVIAAVGFIEVAKDIGEKLSEWIADWIIFTEEEKKAFEQAKEFNKELAAGEENLKKQREANAESLLSGAARIQAQIDALQKPKSEFQVFPGRFKEATPEAVAIQATNEKIAALTQQRDRELQKEAQAAQAAQDAQALAAAQSQLAIINAGNAAEIQANEQAYEKGKESLAVYLNNRQTILEKQIAAEAAVLSTELKNAQAELTRVQALPASAERDTKAIAAATKVAQVQAQIKAEGLKADEQRAAVDADFTNKATANAQKVIEFRRQDLELQGKVTDAAQSKLNLDKQIFEQALLATGRTTEEIKAELDAWEKRQKLAADFLQTQKQAQAEFSDFEARRRAAAIIDQEQGPFSDAARANVAAMRKEIQDLTEDLKKMQADAIPGNEEQAKAIGELTGKIQEMQRAVNQIDVGQRFKASLSADVAADIFKFFETGIEGAHSFGDAMRGLADSVVQSVQQIVAQLLQMQLESAFLNLLGGVGGGGGASDFASVAAATQFHAAGGLISGPGGPTSDAIPARLSAGEFVLTADATRAIGAQNLEDLNRAFRGASAPSSMSHFAEGGLAGAGAGAADVNMNVGLDDGLILRSLKSRGAARVILQQLSNNPKAANRALSRST